MNKQTISQLAAHGSQLDITSKYERMTKINCAAAYPLLKPKYERIPKINCAADIHLTETPV
jgi:hypothetical protein